jgi:glycogen debranching enzyme
VAVIPPIDTTLLAATLRELGGVTDLSELGANGPLVASAGSDSLFNTLFGRDAIRMAADLLHDFPSVARVTLLELARRQGVRHNPRADEEPGRILHEDRAPDDPIGVRLAELWDFPYYGSVDATPQWVTLLADFCQVHGPSLLATPLTDRLGRRVTVRDSLVAALAWILGRLDDPGGHGYLWVLRASPSGIPTQVWEDSGDSHHFEDGRLFDFSRPFAPVAPQGYAHDALRGGADLLERAGRPSPFSPDELRRRAGALRAKVLAEFWQPEMDTFALALVAGADGRLRPARVVASSPGHLLASRLLDGVDCAPFRDRLVERLLRPDMLAGAGLRTRSTSAPRFRAGSYHNGSTWPMDTGVVADGLRRHGYQEAADDLELRVLRGCSLVGGFPEFFRGDADGAIRVNTAVVDAAVDGVPNRLEQPPQMRQGWTATRVWRILRRLGAIEQPTIP